MTSALDIQIVSSPNLEKIENFLKDATYRETIEFSANFNTRLCIERRLRLPFLDPQTGVAQNHSNLYMDRRQRMPGFREGQIYSYPASRWRKSRRQYLSKIYKYSDRPFQALKRAEVGIDADSDFNGTILEESSSLGGADTSDSKDSQNLKEELPKEWFYDEMDINEIDSLDDPKSPADDEYDYDPRYGNKKRRKTRRGVKKAASLGHVGDTPPVRKGRPAGGGGGAGSGSTSGRGRGRRKATRDSRHIDPPSPGVMPEPPSFESAAAAVEGVVTTDDHAELRNYRKYL